MSDEELMESVREGNVSALGTLFKRYHKHLFGYFVRLTHDRQLSEDLTQATFERVLRYRTSYRGDGTFRAWIFSVARNVKVDHHRRNRIVVDQRVEMADLKILTPTVSLALEERERREALERAVRELPETYRETLLLVWKQELKYREVAEILGTTETNVKSRMHRAVRALRKKLCKK